MKYMNVVKFKVKLDCVNDYIKALNNQPSWKGNIESRAIQTGDSTFCIYGLWESKEAMETEMENMVDWLDTVRDMLEEISPELGVTDPVSGPVIWEKK